MSKRKNFNKYNKTWVSWFNKNKTKELYDEILKEKFPNNKRCRCCNNPIYYYDSTFRLGKDLELYLNKKSYKSQKVVLNNVYYLSVCEDCLTENFPEYQTLNKSRVFNRICDITCFAFDIPKEVSEKWKNENYSITLENLILKHGEIEGKKKWEDYCSKQAISNTYEYKKEKHGWTKYEFNEFNKSRSITIENLIKKHGEEKGLEIWNNYIDKQRYSCTQEYFIKEYGEFIGFEKWKNFNNKRISIGCVSNISQELFNMLDSKLKYKTFYATKNKEVEISDEKHLYYLDYYIEDLNIVIEFNGDMWHANPIKYKEYDIVNPFKKILAKDVWEYDKKRIEFLKTKVKDVIIVWEKDLKEKGLEKLTNEILEKINSYK